MQSLPKRVRIAHKLQPKRSELCPLLTAIATELGNMVVSQEIEAYIAVGINPIKSVGQGFALFILVDAVITLIYYL